MRKGCYHKFVIAVTLLLPSTSCGWTGRQGPSRCCVDVSTDRLLEEPPPVEGVEDGEAIVQLRFDSKAVVATIGDRQRRIGYFYSEDGGLTWYRDRLYQEINDQLTRRQGPTYPLPWIPPPRYPKIMYRTVYARQGEGYPERSIDGGQTWSQMKHTLKGCGAELRSCGRYYYHPIEPLTIYASCELPGLAGRFGLYASVDGGDSFRLMLETGLMSGLAVSSADPKIMYAAGVHGSVLKSTDRGESWRLVGQNDQIRKTHVRAGAVGNVSGEEDAKEWDTQIFDIAVDPNDPAIVYLVTTKGILRTEDGGKSWCWLDVGIKRANAIHSLVVVLGKPNVLLIGTYRGLMRSVDGGCRWESIDVLSQVVP